jgi:asparaginyl-tRNA synthetase
MEKWSRKYTLIKDLLSNDEGVSYIGKSITLCGWAVSLRVQGAGKLAFIGIKDGSSPNHVQVITKNDPEETITDGFEESTNSSIGSAVQIVGEVIASLGKGQKIELVAKKFSLTGQVDAKYQLGKGQHSVEFMRELPHLRVKSNLISVVSRIAHRLFVSTHKFFDDRGFTNVRTPLIVDGDCEGAGEMFQVTTILPHKNEPISKILTTEDGKIDYTKDFFGKPVNLTVSGQLHLESYGQGLRDVYCFGPTFRAENSHTSKHLAEFWMVEPEIFFADMNDCINLAEDYVKFCLNQLLTQNIDDLIFLDKFVEKGLINRLEYIISNNFGRITYTNAIKLLNDPENLKLKKYQEIEWGTDLSSDHEKFLAKDIHNKPVFVTDYPEKIKSFYMKENEDGVTVKAFDLLVPGIGELIGGSERENNYDKLIAKMEKRNMDIKQLGWYVDLRKFGGAQHGGFGLGFERLVQYVTSQNIRDLIPYPRYPDHCLF